MFQNIENLVFSKLCIDTSATEKICKLFKLNIINIDNKPKTLSALPFLDLGKDKQVRILKFCEDLCFKQKNLGGPKYQLYYI